MTSYSRNHFVVIFFLWIAIHVLLYIRLDIRTGLYDAVLYLKGADFFYTHGRFEDPHHIFYAIPILILVLFKGVTTDHILAYVLFQCLLSGVAALALYRSSATLFSSANAGLLAACLFLCWWDNLQWNTVVMTESIACSLTCLVLYQLVHFRDTLRHYFILLLLLTLTFFTRPTGVIIILGTVVFILARHWELLNRKPVRRNLVIILLASMGYLCAVLLFSHWDLTEQYMEGNIITYMNTIEGGKLYDSSLRLSTAGLTPPDPSDTPLVKMLSFVIDNPTYFFKAFCLKIWYLLSGLRPYYSFSHNLFTGCWMLMIYGLFFIGYRIATWNNQVRLFAVSIIAVNCLLIGVAAVDWDNRFYLPMEPGIVLLASGGGNYLIQLTRTFLRLR